MYMYNIIQWHENSIHILHVCKFALRTIEDLYTELVREGIVVKCPKTRLSEFVGDYRYTYNYI